METHDFGYGPISAHKHPNGGGWVADDCSVSSDSFIAEDSRVTGGSRVDRGSVVTGGSVVDGRSVVDGGSVVTATTDVLALGPIGSRQAVLTVLFNQPGVRIVAGCWIGTLDEFEARVKEVHGGATHAQEYGAAIAFIRALWATRERLI